ncbi:MAG: hypothetical protein RR547_01530 [Raoultibacter sp.]
MPLLRASVDCDSGPVSVLCDERGQGTVEYALVLFSLLAIIVACGVLWHAIETGSFVDHAAMSASHNLASVSPGAFVDVLLY